MANTIRPRGKLLLRNPRECDIDPAHLIHKFGEDRNSRPGREPSPSGKSCRRAGQDPSSWPPGGSVPGQAEPRLTVSGSGPQDQSRARPHPAASERTKRKDERERRHQTGQRGSMMRGSPCLGRGSRRRRCLAAGLLAVAAVGVSAAPALAVIGGVPDGSGHPYVAAIGQPDGGGIVFTGVAISPTVILTVAHGARRLERATGSDQARVTFDPTASSSSTWFTGTIHINPDWNPRIGIGTGDLAVITFNHPLPVTPASLPPAGLLDQLGQPALLATRFNVIGYGLARFQGGPNGGGRPQPDFMSGGTRKIDRQFFLSFDSEWVWFHLPGGDQLCPGDSGSPSLLGNANLVVGVSLGGIGGIESGCNSSGSVADTRLDIPSARAFIGQYVTLP